MSNNKNNNNHKNQGHNSRRNAGAASRESRRNQDDARKVAKVDDVVTDADRARLQMQQRQANQLGNGEPKLRVIPLGGQDGVGNKNMAVIEYGNDAIVIDTGFNLGLDLPGINYSIPDITYLESIKHKVRGYVFTHGHLDHIGATPYILPKVPAPIYGSRFTIGMIEKQLEGSDLDIDGFEPESVVMNIDNHERLKVGPFFVELIRFTHSIPDACGVVVDTPAGRIVHTGDFRLDPEPLDQQPSDVERVKEIGKDGILLLMAESTNTEQPGRTPTEHTLEQSLRDILAQAPGRVIVATFSSNINRIQMIIDGATKSNRKVAIDGRSMLATVEMSVKLGYIKIPKGTIVSMKEIASHPDSNAVIICTGSQGEPNAALQRMAVGEHNTIKIKQTDTVILSSNPIPGNEVSVTDNVDGLMRRGATVLRDRTHEIDGCGPLHVSGHGNRDELKEMIQMTKPKYIMPNHGPYVHRHRYIGLALEATGMRSDNVALINNGDILEFDKNGKMTKPGSVPTGSVLVDQTGAVVPNLVIKDRVLMGNDGIVVVVVTADKQSKRLLSSPDIISRGFVYMQEQTELIEQLRNNVRDFVAKNIGRRELKEFKQDLRDEVGNLLFHDLGRAPIVIPVVNMVGSGGDGGNRNRSSRPRQDGGQGNGGGGRPQNRNQNQGSRQGSRSRNRPPQNRQQGGQGRPQQR